MNKLQARIMNMHFEKTAKRFVVLALLIVILGGVLTGVMFRTQINEAVTHYQTYENDNGNGSQKDYGKNNRYSENGYNENRGDRERGHDYEKADFFESGLFTKPSVGAEIVLGVYAGLCLLIALAYWLLIAAWLYQAAAKASMAELLWAALGFFFNIFAVIAFVIVRSLQPVCPGCGVRQKAAAYCRTCGTAMKRKCPGCGASADAEDAYCSHCGKALKNDKDSETE